MEAGMSNLGSWNENLRCPCFSGRGGIVVRFIMGSLMGRLCSLRNMEFAGKEFVLFHLLVFVNIG